MRSFGTQAPPSPEVDLFEAVQVGWLYDRDPDHPDRLVYRTIESRDGLPVDPAVGPTYLPRIVRIRRKLDNGTVERVVKAVGRVLAEAKDTELTSVAKTVERGGDLVSEAEADLGAAAAAFRLGLAIQYEVVAEIIGADVLREIAEDTTVTNTELNAFVQHVVETTGALAFLGALGGGDAPDPTTRA